MSDESTSLSRTDRLRRRRRLERCILILGVALLALSSMLDHLGVFGYRGDDWAQYDRQACVVEEVVDGDTVRVGCNDHHFVVQLLGVDAPELSEGSDFPSQHWAAQARQYAEARLCRRTALLRLEPTQTRDPQGRLLVYLYLGDTDNVNLDLVRDGQAYADRRFAHSLRPQFELAEAEAMKQRRGLWQELTPSQMPDWRQRWLRERLVN